MNFQKEKDFIMDTFNFQRVEQVMHYLNWGWARTQGMPPEEYDLRQEARRLLDGAYESSVKYNDYFSISTGGFKAICDVENDHLELLFILESGGNV